MKSLGGLGFCFLFLLGCGDKVSLSGKQCRTHLPLEMSAQEYSRCIQAEGILKEIPKTEEDKALREIIRVGGRALEWEKQLKETPFKEKKQLKSPEMLEPVRYNGKTIITDFVDVSAAIPLFMRDVLFSNGGFPMHVPLDEDSFYYYLNLIKRNYSYASRWVLLKRYLPELKKLRTNDIRGYSFLSQVKNLKSVLNQYSSLSAENKEQYKQWLLQMCFVFEGSDSECQIAWNKTEQASRGFYDFYLKYKDQNKYTYDRFFKIDAKRSDVSSTNNASLQTFNVPFNNVSSGDVQNFVQSSIERKWQGAGWKLLLSFIQSNENTPRVEFVEGALPHVDKLAGNLITMDDNISLSDPDNQATMAHEFGHVLGFPDCYVEFFDSRDGLMVNYYIDTSNLMCSRSGQVLPTHYEQLKTTYSRLQKSNFFDFLRP